ANRLQTYACAFGVASRINRRKFGTGQTALDVGGACEGVGGARAAGPLQATRGRSCASHIRNTCPYHLKKGEKKKCPERRPAAFQKWYIKGADAEHGAARCGNTLPGYRAQALPRTGLHVPGKTKNLSPTKKAAVRRYMCHSEAVASKFYVPLSTEEARMKRRKRMYRRKSRYRRKRTVKKRKKRKKAQKNQKKKKRPTATLERPFSVLHAIKHKAKDILKY
ncbi:uncharacterized protein LOC125787465, partial [Astyanax mexicanus]